MRTPRRIQIFKGTGTVLAVAVLSSTIARWNAFRAAPGPGTYAGLLVLLTLFLLLMLGLAVVVYAEEKARGRIVRPRAFFDTWSDRLFSNPDAPEPR